MSKEQNLSPPPPSPSPQVKDFNPPTTSLPPLPDDFLSFQPQSSYSINDVDNGAANSFNVGQEQRREGRGTYYNKERYNNYSRSGGGGGNNYRSHGSYRPPKSDQRLGGQQQRQRGRWNNSTSSKVTI